MVGWDLKQLIYFIRLKTASDTKAILLGKLKVGFTHRIKGISCDPNKLKGYRFT